MKVQRKLDKKVIVISGINMTDSGILSILTDCLSYIANNLNSEYKIIALVPDKSRFTDYNIELHEFSLSKKNWIFRLYYEYVYFYFFSKRINPYLWLSLHDMTPNVKAKIRAVYCHNVSAFYHVPAKFIFFDKKFSLFSIFYNYLYRINIKKNNYIIVQQEWLRNEFKKMFHINNIIVSHPIAKFNKNLFIPETKVREKDSITFFYPSYPRVFKNFEVICEASKLLIQSGYTNFEVILTLGPNINKYGDYIYNKYSHIPNLKFVGLIRREEVFANYYECDCVIFPSKLESWGLPISEAMTYNKPVIVSSLPYAKEVLNGYDLVNYFEPDNVYQLKSIMEAKINKSLIYDSVVKQDTPQPFAKGWDELFSMILR